MLMSRQEIEKFAKELVDGDSTYEFNPRIRKSLTAFLVEFGLYIVATIQDRVDSTEEQIR